MNSTVNMFISHTVQTKCHSSWCGNGYLCKLGTVAQCSATGKMGYWRRTEHNLFGMYRLWQSSKTPAGLVYSEWHWIAEGVCSNGFNDVNRVVNDFNFGGPVLLYNAGLKPLSSLRIQFVILATGAWKPEMALWTFLSINTYFRK